MQHLPNHLCLLLSFFLVWYPWRQDGEEWINRNSDFSYWFENQLRFEHYAITLFGFIVTVSAIAIVFFLYLLQQSALFRRGNEQSLQVQQQKCENWNRAYLESDPGRIWWRGFHARVEALADVVLIFWCGFHRPTLCFEVLCIPDWARTRPIIGPLARTVLGQPRNWHIYTTLGLNWHVLAK